MGLHKIKNGKRVEYTPEEEKARLEEWEREKIKFQTKLKEFHDKKKKFESNKKSAMTKLQTLGLTEDETYSLITRIEDL